VEQLKAMFSREKTKETEEKSSLSGAAKTFDATKKLAFSKNKGSTREGKPLKGILKDGKSLKHSTDDGPLWYKKREKEIKKAVKNVKREYDSKIRKDPRKDLLSQRLDKLRTFDNIYKREMNDEISRISDKNGNLGAKLKGDITGIRKSLEKKLKRDEKLKSLSKEIASKEGGAKKTAENGYVARAFELRMSSYAEMKVTIDDVRKANHTQEQSSSSSRDMQVSTTPESGPRSVRFSDENQIRIIEAHPEKASKQNHLREERGRSLSRELPYPRKSSLERRRRVSRERTSTDNLSLIAEQEEPVGGEYQGGIPLRRMSAFPSMSDGARSEEPIHGIRRQRSSLTLDDVARMSALLKIAEERRESSD